MTLTPTQIAILNGQGRPSPMGPIAQSLGLGTFLDDLDALTIDLDSRVEALEEDAVTETAIALGDDDAEAFVIAEDDTPYLTFDTTDDAEKIIASKRLTVTDGVASGTERIVGGLAYVDPSASTAVTGATETATNFDNTYTLPAGSLKVGTVVRIRATGIYTATTGAETHTFAVMLGAVSLGVTGNIDPDDNDRWIIEFTFEVRSVGATGTVVGTGLCHSGTPGSATGVRHIMATGSAGTSTATVDTTAASVIAIAVDRQGTATDSDSMRMDTIHAEILG